MSRVDKFGRSIGGGNLVRGSKPGPKGEGFLLDAEGNYIVSNKRIKQLHDPEYDTDAVNMRWSVAKLEQIQKKWIEAMNLGELCMEDIRDLEKDSLELESRIEKLEKKWEEAAQVWVQAKNPDGTIYTIANTNVEPTPKK